MASRKPGPEKLITPFLLSALASALLLLLLPAWVELLPAAHAKSRIKVLLVDDAEPADESVFDRGLVSERQSYKTILTEHSKHWKNTSHRHFNGTVLAYLTPWNSKGYDVALKFRDKFTHVSPVWYQIKGDSSAPVLQGSDGVNQRWMKKLRAGKTTVKLVPRFVVEGDDVAEALCGDEQYAAAAIDLLVDECRTRAYDGLVLEVWSVWAHAMILGKRHLRPKAVAFIKNVALALQKLEPPREAFVAIPPHTTGAGVPANVFTDKDLTELVPHVAGFSLMSYDFPTGYHVGPNAPMAWVRASLAQLLKHVRPARMAELRRMRQEAHYGRELRSAGGDGGEGDEIAAKVLLGLNFYGRRFEESPDIEVKAIVGREFLDAVDKYHPKFKWDEASVEHHFKYSTGTGAKFHVYYPTLNSIAERLNEARAWGIGIAIWELGQGLDYFYDLL